MGMRGLMRKWRRETEPWYGAIGLANLVVGTSSILIPLMVAQVLRGTVENVGLISSLASLMGVIGSLVWGRLSDVAHRRKVFVVISYVMVAASFLGIAFAHSLTSIVLLNMVLNLFWVANASVSILLVIENRDESAWEGRIGRLNQLGTLGWVAGLVFGSVGLALAAPHIGEAAAIRSVFGVLALGGLVAALLAARHIPRTKPRFVQRRFRGMIVALGNFIVERARFAPYHLYHRFNPRRLPELLWGEGGLRRETKHFLLAMLLAFTAFGFFFVPLPILLAERFGFASSTVFSYFVVLNGAIVVAYPLAARRIKRVGNKSVQAGALLARVLLFAIGGAFLLLSRVAPSRIVLSMFFFAVGVSWSFFQLSGVALASRLARPEYRGQALGLYNAVAGLGTIFAGVASGLLAGRFGYAVTMFTAAGLLTASLVVMLRLPVPYKAASQVRPTAARLIGRKQPASS
ncbi:MAG TPA: MFS transporter [Candidatus Acetothermia bacterium]|nr:MFS transporter [Candidatus Acetothermia bacterium]